MVKQTINYFLIGYVGDFLFIVLYLGSSGPYLGKNKHIPGVFLQAATPQTLSTFHGWWPLPAPARQVKCCSAGCPPALPPAAPAREYTK